MSTGIQNELLYFWRVIDNCWVFVTFMREEQENCVWSSFVQLLFKLLRTKRSPHLSFNNHNNAEYIHRTINLLEYPIPHCTARARHKNRQLLISRNLEVGALDF